MNHLLREQAPISSGAWRQVDAEAASRLETFLGARRLVDFRGPHGWDHSAVNTGRFDEVTDTPHPDLRVRSRRVLPVVELHIPFTLSRAELDAIDRGASNPDLGPVAEAARTIAQAETTAVFHGYPSAGIEGIASASTHSSISLSSDPERYTIDVASAVQRLMESGVGGPFGLALSSSVWATVVETSQHGYPLFEHLRRAIVGGSIVWAPGLRGAVLLSQRGGDFLFDSGQDLSVGYLSHTADTVTLYLEESFTFRVLEGDAAVILTGA